MKVIEIRKWYITSAFPCLSLSTCTTIKNAKDELWKLINYKEKKKFISKCKPAAKVWIINEKKSKG